MKQQHKKLERLLLFSEVAQSLSFTIAAEKLGISRGHLSAQIKKLEADLVKIANREAKLAGENFKLNLYDKLLLDEGSPSGKPYWERLSERQYARDPNFKMFVYGGKDFRGTLSFKLWNLS